MQAMNTKVNAGALACFYYFVFYLTLYLFYNFFDARRMDTSVGYQLMQGKPGNLSANRVKTGKNDVFRCIINNNLYTRGCLQRTYVSAFTPNNTSLDFIALDVKNGN